MISDDQISFLLHEHTPEPSTLLRPEAFTAEQDPAKAVSAPTTAWPARRFAVPRFAVPRFAGAVIAAAAVAGVVAGSVALADRRDTANRNNGSTVITSRGAPTSSAPWAAGYSTVAATWLPPGAATVDYSSAGLGERTGRVEAREYTIRNNSGAATVQIALDPGASLPAGPGQGVPWRNLTVGGYPARQWSGATWNWVKILRGKTVVTMELDSGHASAATLRAWARHIAVGLRYDRHERVRAAFGVGPLPSALHPVEVTAGTASTTVDSRTATIASYILSRTGALDNVVVELIPHQSDLTHARINQPGRPVQGRATYTSKAGEVPALRMVRAVGGQDLSIFAEFAGARGATLAQLYAIADKLILHS